MKDRTEEISNWNLKTEKRERKCDESQIEIDCIQCFMHCRPLCGRWAHFHKTLLPSSDKRENIQHGSKAGRNIKIPWMSCSYFFIAAYRLQVGWHKSSWIHLWQYFFPPDMTWFTNWLYPVQEKKNHNHRSESSSTILKIKSRVHH